MLRRFNYTKRITIRKSDVMISTREVSGAPPVATIGVNLDGYDLPPDAELVVEAYRMASYMREKIGTVGDRPGTFELALKQFDSPTDVKFRIKVVGRDGKAGKSAPILLAVADNVGPSEGDDDDADIEKLLSLVPAELNGEVWRVDVTERPVLLIEKAYWEDRRTFVPSRWFFPLVAPTLLREALRAALANYYRELDEDCWQSRWLTFAMTLPVDEGLPPEKAGDDVIDDWVNRRVEAFSRLQKVRTRIEPLIRGED